MSINDEAAGCNALGRLSLVSVAAHPEPPEIASGRWRNGVASSGQARAVAVSGTTPVSARGDRAIGADPVPL
ncbi:MAG: hypothetical protein ACYTF9_15260, partial [Planctomycetota bacterium]